MKTTISCLFIVVALLSKAHAQGAALPSQNRFSPTVPAKQTMASRAPLMLFSLSPDSSPPSQNVGNPDNLFPDEASNFTNVVNYLNGSGLSSIVRGIDLDDNWYDVAANWPEADTVNFAHTNGMYVELWIAQNCPITNGIGSNFPQSYDTFHETNQQVWINAFSNYISQGYDSFKLDPSFGVTDMGQGWDNLDTAEWMKSTIQTLAAEMGRSVAVSGKSGDGKFNPAYMNGFVHWDYGVTIMYYTWADFFHTFNRVVGGINFAGNGAFPFYPEFQDFGGNLANLRGFLSMIAIVPLSSYMATTNWTPAEMVLLTNQDWQAVYKDNGGMAGFMIYSNTVGNNEETWVRQMGNGDWVVSFINGTKPGPVMDTITWPQLGIPANQPMWVRDVWAQTNAVFTGSFTCTTPSNSATLFRISPATNYFNAVTAGSIAGNGSGLTNVPASGLTGGITTNILIGGHAFYYINGVLMNIK
jgi:hypothetical protein